MLNQKNLIAVVISFVVIHIAVTFSAHALFQGSVPQQTAWEYKIYETKTEREVVVFYEITTRNDNDIATAVVKHRAKVTKDLEDLGQDGWEIYWVTETAYSFGTNQQIFYLKRPL